MGDQESSRHVSRDEFANIIRDTVKNADIVSGLKGPGPSGRGLYVKKGSEGNEATVVILTQDVEAGGTAFRPTTGLAYVQRLIELHN